MPFCISSTLSLSLLMDIQSSSHTLSFHILCKLSPRLLFLPPPILSSLHPFSLLRSSPLSILSISLCSLSSLLSPLSFPFFSLPSLPLPDPLLLFASLLPSNPLPFSSSLFGPPLTHVPFFSFHPLYSFSSIPPLPSIPLPPLSFLYPTSH